MAAIEVRELHKSYGNVDAVRGVSFSVHEGEVLALLGPNGAGKTTIVEILEGFRARTSGEVRVLGTDPGRAGAELRQRIGIVLQSCGIDAYLTAREVLTMHGEYYDRRRDADEVLALVGLADKAGSRVKTLSGGQARRLDVALGLIGDPDLLFLDEPTTGFDPSARRHAWEIVRNLRSLGKTVLLTTHYMDEAQHLADRVIVIAKGRVVAEGPPATIGGRAGAGQIVSFSVPSGAPPPPLPGQAVDGRPGAYSFETADVTRDLHTLTGWALQAGLELADLTVTKPSLEDVYLQLVDER